MTNEEPFTPFACAECGGYVEMDVGPGRFREVRKGVKLEVPEDFGVPTCIACGEKYLSAERGKALRERWIRMGFGVFMVRPEDLAPPSFPDWRPAELVGVRPFDSETIIRIPRKP